MALDQFLLFGSDLIALFAIYAILVIGLNIQQGITGIPNFGLLFAVAGGAYITAGLSVRLVVIILGIHSTLDPISENTEVLQLVNPILRSQPLTAIGLLIFFVVIGGIAGGITGLIAAAPAIRLREDYLAITLLAFGEILNVIATGYTPLVGGPPGISVPDVLSEAGGQYRFYVASGVLLLWALLVFAYAGYFVKTPLGRTLKAIRDNETTAKSLGKPITHYRTIAILFGSILCGMSGTLWVLYSGAITPTLARYDWTFLPWLMLLLGGMGSNRGSFVGAFLLVAVNKLIVYYKFAFVGILPFDVVWLNYILLGLVTAIILIYRPQGITRDKRTVPRDILRLAQKELGPNQGGNS